MIAIAIIPAKKEIPPTNGTKLFGLGIINELSVLLSCIYFIIFFFTANIIAIIRATIPIPAATDKPGFSLIACEKNQPNLKPIFSNRLRN